MRKILFALVFIVLFVIACGREREIRQLEEVRIYEAINGEVEYSERAFKGADAELFSDIVRAECPQGVGTEFVRIELQAPTSTLILYTDESGENITCSVLKPKEQQPPILKTQAEAPAAGVAVTVNGKQIMIADIQAALQRLPSNAQQNDTTINLIINELINTELLRQEAAKVELSAEEITKRRADILSAANVTEEQLQANLARQNITAAQFEASLKEEAQIETLLNERLLLEELQITDETARQYYLQNPNMFLQSEQAVMRQILISGQGRTEQQVQARAQQVANLINSTDFCELVTRFSDDNQTKQNCGVYVIPRGVIDPNLELASFSTPANQTSVVATQSGIHFVQTLQVTQAQVVPYSQAAPALQQNLRNAIIQQRLNLYMQTLRAQAEIVSYLG